MEKGRRKKIRYIQKMPRISQFSPRGKPGRPDETELRVDEYEAIKLADFQGYDQSEGAMAMGISRPSFGRILRNGRTIVADALVNGKIIRIRTGNVQVGVRHRNFPSKDRSSASKEFNLRSQLQEESLRRNIVKFTRTKGRRKKDHGV